MDRVPVENFYLPSLEHCLQLFMSEKFSFLLLEDLLDNFFLSSVKLFLLKQCYYCLSNLTPNDALSRKIGLVLL